MRTFFFLVSLYFISTGVGSTRVWADEATDFCRSVNGTPKNYKAKDSEGNWAEAELCWFGDAALGSWTLYRYANPRAKEPSSPGEVPGLGQLEGFLEKNSLNLVAIEMFLTAVGGSDEEPALPGVTTREYKILEDNPAYLHCIRLGGRPMSLTGELPPKDAPMWTERRDNPRPSVCYFLDLEDPEHSSAIELRTLYWGVGRGETDPLMKVLLREARER